MDSVFFLMKYLNDNKLYLYHTMPALHTMTIYDMPKICQKYAKWYANNLPNDMPHELPNYNNEIREMQGDFYQSDAQNSKRISSPELGI